jgi:hypothetical protein
MNCRYFPGPEHSFKIKPEEFSKAFPTANISEYSSEGPLPRHPATPEDHVVIIGAGAMGSLLAAKIVLSTNLCVSILSSRSVLSVCFIFF